MTGIRREDEGTLQLGLGSSLCAVVLDEVGVGGVVLMLWLFLFLLLLLLTVPVHLLLVVVTSTEVGIASREGAGNAGRVVGVAVAVVDGGAVRDAVAVYTVAAAGGVGVDGVGSRRTIQR